MKGTIHTLAILAIGMAALLWTVHPAAATTLWVEDFEEPVNTVLSTLGYTGGNGNEKVAVTAEMGPARNRIMSSGWGLCVVRL